MKDNAEKHHRRTIRLKDYDYSHAGAYFVTVCAWKKECLFGEIVDREVRLNDYGQVVMSEWQATAMIRHEVKLDEFIIMPNHLHGIVIINTNGPCVGANGCSPKIRRTEQMKTGRSAESPLRIKQKSISSLIAGFKSAVTKSINVARSAPGAPVWQRNYYEHIIRNEKELHAIRQYIRYNPMKWDEDDENPDKTGKA